MRGWLTMVCVLASAAPAYAGNDDSFFQGNEAAMQGGAVAATGTGAGQLWYNPGALSIGEGNRIELSGSLFSLRFRKLDPYMEIGAPDGSVVAANSERSVDFLSVPSALSYTRRIGSRVRAGIGVFVQAQDAVDLDNTLRWDDGAGTDLAYRRSLKFSQQRLFAGPGLSVDLGNLSLGASLFFVYEQSAYEEISSLFVNAPGPSTAAATEEYRVDTRRYGLELVLGAHLKLGRVHAGLVLRGPRFRLTDELSVGRVGTESYTTTTGSQVTTADEPPFAFRSDRPLAAPARLVFALGYVTGDLTLAAEIDVAHPYSGFEEYIWTYNVRAGAKIAVTDSMALGVGFFTDRANVASSSSAFQSFLDYYGGNLAVSTATPVGVRHEEGDESPDQLVFHTTVSLRYAAGVGNGSGAIALADQIDDDASIGVFLFGEEQRLLAHELALYIGSGLDF